MIGSNQKTFPVYILFVHILKNSSKAGYNGMRTVFKLPENYITDVTLACHWGIFCFKQFQTSRRLYHNEIIWVTRT